MILIACKHFIHITYLCGIYLFMCLGHDSGHVVQHQNTTAGKCIKSFLPQPNMCPPPQQVLAVTVAS